MKHINKFLIIAMVWVMSSCGDLTNLDINDNPNAITPEQAGIEFLYNSVALSFNGFFQSTWGFAGGLSRQFAMTGGFTYQSAFAATNFNGIWTTAYAGLIPDIDALIAQAEPIGLDVHTASAKVMKAYTLMTLVDMFGDIPFSEISQGTDIISPKQDSGADIYAAAGTLLDEAIATLSNTETTATPSGDLYYGGDAASWATAAKSLKLRMFNNIRLVDASGATSGINALLSEGDLIDSAAEDFQFQYGLERDLPNSRHPRYNNQYENNDGNYMSNYYMWTLVGEKENVDPRTRYYFYRKDGNLTNEDDNIWDCFVDATPFDGNGEQRPAPPHYTDVDPNMPYCIASPAGWFGRDHANSQGIPPDGPVRTAYGLYPAGGKFDNNSFGATQNGGTDGGQGQGISPLLLSSNLFFIRAEAALMLGTSDDAREMLQAGIEASMDKVRGFESLIPSADLNFVVGTNPDTGEPIPASVLLILDEDVTAYVDGVLASYDAATSADERLDIIMKEAYIAAWGNGVETYNGYRRTSKPANMQPAIEVGAGLFTRSALYPAVHVNLNATATQKDPANPGKVFWDTNADPLR